MVNSIVRREVGQQARVKTPYVWKPSPLEEAIVVRQFTPSTFPPLSNRDAPVRADTRLKQLPRRLAETLARRSVPGCSHRMKGLLEEIGLELRIIVHMRTTSSRSAPEG